MTRYIYYFVLAVRLIFAPLIFVWPFISVIISFLLDLIDGDIAAYAVSEKNYQIIDKTVDFWVYTFEMIYAWINFQDFRLLLLALLLWRLVGMVLFYMTSNRRLFIVFGNYFENIFYLIFFGVTVPALNWLVHNGNVYYFAVIAVSIVKFFQEWFVHVAELSVREDVFKSKRKWRH